MCREVGQCRLYYIGRRSEGVGVVEREERKGEQGGSAELRPVFALSRVQADRMDALSARTAKHRQRAQWEGRDYISRDGEQQRPATEYNTQGAARDAICFFVEQRRQKTLGRS